MALYGIIFGSFPALSVAEIEAIIPSLKLREGKGELWSVSQSAVLLEGPSDDVMIDLFDRLGGAVRLVSVVFQSLATSAIPGQLSKCLNAIVWPRPIFGITVVGDGRGGITPLMIQRWGLELKKEFRVSGRSSRFVFDKNLILSAAQVKKNQMLEKGGEFVIVGNQGRWSIGTTLAIQDVDEWAERDMERPRRNARRGMLPPKIARIMVNLAGISHRLGRGPARCGGNQRHSGEAMPRPESAGSDSGQARMTTILDPFCGSGTVLMEALQLGYSVIGSDVSTEAVGDTKQNLEWLNIQCHSGPRAGIQKTIVDPRIKSKDDGSFNLFISDVRSLAQKLPPHSIDAIVTEPDLGPPQGRLLSSAREIERTRTQLASLYISAFEEFRKLLKPGGRVVMSLPVWRVGPPHTQLIYAIKDLNTIKGFKIIPPISRNLEPITYHLSPRPTLLYGRPEQFVWREILILKTV